MGRSHVAAEMGGGWLELVEARPVGLFVAPSELTNSTSMLAFS